MNLINWLLVFIIVAVVISFFITLLLKGHRKTSKVMQYIPTYLSIPLLLYDLIYGYLNIEELEMGLIVIFLFAISLAVIICINMLTVYLLNIRKLKNK